MSVTYQSTFTGGAHPEVPDSQAKGVEPGARVAQPQPNTTGRAVAKPGTEILCLYSNDI